MHYLECSNCQETPTVEEWRKANRHIKILGLQCLPINGFKNESEFLDFQETSGTRLDCPICEELNCIEDINFY